jgi:hypothetical protein
MPASDIDRSGMDEHKAQREPIEIPPEFTQGKETSRGPSVRHHYRRGRMLQVERPVAPTSRAKLAERALSLPRATAGHTIWRDVPSRFQVRSPSKELATLKATQSPPWSRKRKARAKAKLAKVSRKANRG